METTPRSGSFTTHGSGSSAEELHTISTFSTFSFLKEGIDRLFTGTNLLGRASGLHFFTWVQMRLAELPDKEKGRLLETGIGREGGNPVLSSLTQSITSADIKPIYNEIASANNPVIPFDK